LYNNAELGFVEFNIVDSVERSLFGL